MVEGEWGSMHCPSQWKSENVLGYCTHLGFILVAVMLSHEDRRIS